MSCFISVDGGGSKLNAMMFDENMNLLGRGLSGGINLTQTSIEDCRANVRDCLSQLMKDGVPEKVETVYFTFVGPAHVLQEELNAMTYVGSYVPTDEALAGILAGSLRDTGVLALSGTGADIFYVSPDKRVVVGAWGPILGDQGSGTWIGQQAIRAVVRLVNGWGEETLLHKMILEEWKIERDWEMVNIVHGSPAPFRKVASLTRVVGRAAEAGDKVALDILNEAGRLLAVQTDSLIRKAKLDDDHLEITLCGGAWKTHPVMLAAYRREVQKLHPTANPRRPMFEHVCAGPARYLLEKGMPREEAIALMRGRFPDYQLDLTDD